MTSPSTLTLGAAKAGSILNIAGVCATSPQFTGQLNEAVQRLMDAGDWWTTVVKARVCLSRNCVAWPRWVGTVLAVKYAGRVRPIQNHWYDFLPISAGECHSPRQSTVAFVDDGLTPVFNNVPCGSSNFIRAYPRHQADADKTITLFGIDANGQEVMTKDSLGAWYQGEILTLGFPYVQSVAAFREVTRVIKDSTSGPLDVYQYVPATGLLLDMAHYEPSETNPMYRHASLRGGYGCAGSNCGCASDGSTARTVEILAKLQFIPVVADTDTVQIDNIPAIKLMIQAIRLEEAGDDDGALKKQAMAIKELNRQLRNKLPLEQIPVEVSSSGTALPSLRGIGRIQ